MLFNLLSRLPVGYHRDVYELKPTWPAAAVTVGSFRSLHTGHRSLITTLIEGAREHRLPAVVVGLQPSPYEVLSGKRLPRLLNSSTRRLLLASWGVDHCVQHRTDRSFLRMSAEAFVEEILLRRLKTKWLVVGDDFRFGHKRGGDVELLKRYERAGDLQVFQLGSVLVDDQRVSTTLVGRAIEKGDYYSLRLLLGRPWSLVARVSSGRGIGAQMGYPTLNIPIVGGLQAPPGVFAGVVEIAGEGVCRAAINVGVRPTVSRSARPVLEAHILDRRLATRPGRVAVHLLQRIRNEQAFASTEALQAQIARDLEQIREYFSYSTLLRDLPGPSSQNREQS